MPIFTIHYYEKIYYLLSIIIFLMYLQGCTKCLAMYRTFKGDFYIKIL